MGKLENHTVEFKQSWHDEHLKTISAFANAEGGNIYIGYDDKGDVIGLKKSEIKKLLENLPEPEFVERKEGIGQFSVVFFKDIFNDEELRKRGLNERQIKAVKYVKEKRRITNKEYQEINMVSNKTAYLELSDLQNKDILITEGKGRSLVYIVNKTL